MPHPATRRVVRPGTWHVIARALLGWTPPRELPWRGRTLSPFATLVASRGGGSPIYDLGARNHLSVYPAEACA